MVLDRIISAASDYLRDLSPLVPQSLVSLNELHLLQVAPLLLVNAWIQLVVPSKKKDFEVFLSINNFSTF